MNAFFIKMKEFKFKTDNLIQDENGIEFSIEPIETISISDKYFQDVYIAETKDTSFSKNPVIEVYQFCELSDKEVNRSNKLFNYDKAMAIAMLNIDEFISNNISERLRREVGL